jgi:hypothetical protein
MESVVIYYDHLEYFTTTKYILWAFGNFLVIWYIFARFGVLYKEKSGNPGPNIFVLYPRPNLKIVVKPFEITMVGNNARFH